MSPRVRTLRSPSDIPSVGADGRLPSRPPALPVSRSLCRPTALASCPSRSHLTPPPTSRTRAWQNSPPPTPSTSRRPTRSRGSRATTARPTTGATSGPTLRSARSISCGARPTSSTLRTWTAAAGSATSGGGTRRCTRSRRRCSSSRRRCTGSTSASSPYARSHSLFPCLVPGVAGLPLTLTAPSCACLAAQYRVQASPVPALPKGQRLAVRLQPARQQQLRHVAPPSPSLDPGRFPVPRCAD